VQAVEGTGRQQLIIAGVVTEVCVAFAALSAVEAGYDVFVVTDASGTFNESPGTPPGTGCRLRECS
jgi:nicotinamidase-related amidase